MRFGQIFVSLALNVSNVFAQQLVLPSNQLSANLGFRVQH